MKDVKRVAVDGLKRPYVVFYRLWEAQKTNTYQFIDTDERTSFDLKLVKVKGFYFKFEGKANFFERSFWTIKVHHQ